MKKPSKRHVLSIALVFVWLIALIGLEDLQIIPCSAFAHDVGYMSTTCSVREIVFNLGNGDVRLLATSYIACVFFFLVIPFLLLWLLKKK